MKQLRPYPAYTVTKKAEHAIALDHPWVYAEEITQLPDAPPENGALVDVCSARGSYLGTGMLSLASKIRIRLLSRNANDQFDAAFWRRRIEYAWAYRKAVLGPEDLPCCRVSFGEADQFPGLTVDRFQDILVTQTLSYGMEQRKDVIFPLLAEVLRQDGQNIRGIYERNDAALRGREGLAEGKGWFPLPGETPPEETRTVICENGIFYDVDFENGQKTGFFLDQKYNRKAVARLARGRRVLDCFTHTGSFALNAAYGGAAQLYGVAPDLAAYGKIVGGGMPLAAYGGRADAMSQVAPLGKVYQAGTLSGNPVATAAGLATLRILREQKDTLYPSLEQKGEKLEEAFRAAGVAVNRIGSLLSPFFTKKPPQTFADVAACDLSAFSVYFRRMLACGQNVAPSQFEAMFLSAAHTEGHLADTCAAIRESCGAALEYMERRNR